MIEYRKLEMSDLPEFINLRIEQLLEEGATKSCELSSALNEHFEKHLKDGTFVSFVATDERGEIVAISGMSYAEKPPYFENPTGKIGIVSGMYTKKEYRRRGISKELLTLTTNAAKEYGCGEVWVSASDVGVMLYTDFGFTHNNNFMRYKFK